MCLANVGAGRVVDLDRVLWRRDLYIPAQPKLRTFSNQYYADWRESINIFT